MSFSSKFWEKSVGRIRTRLGTIGFVIRVVRSDTESFLLHLKNLSSRSVDAKSSLLLLKNAE